MSLTFHERQDRAASKCLDEPASALSPAQPARAPK